MLCRVGKLPLCLRHLLRSLDSLAEGPHQVLHHIGKPLIFCLFIRFAKYIPFLRWSLPKKSAVHPVPVAHEPLHR